MKVFSLTLALMFAGASGRAFAQSPEQVPPAMDPSAQYRQPDDAYDPGDDAQPSGDEAFTTEDVPQNVDEATFRDSLAGFGAWVTVDGIGRVWRPYPTVVGADFQPYVSYGHWVYTNVGWTWASDWDWGWAPFHYGRWWFDDYYGWVWLPGYTWGPAWVSWRWGDGYIGWSPLAPWGHHYRRNYWGHSWCFVDEHHFTSDRVYTHREPANRVEVIHDRTAPTTARSGPPVGNIAHATGTPVPVRALPESGALPVSNAMRPRPAGTGGASGGNRIQEPRAEPSNVARPEAIRPSESRPMNRPENVTPARPSWQPQAQPAERPSQARPAERPQYTPPARRSERPSYSPPSRSVERPSYSPPARPVAPAAPVARPQANVHPAVPEMRPSAPAARPAPAKKK
jgi:hypothetical protein